MTLKRSGPSNIATALELVQLQPSDATLCAPGQVPLPAVDREPFGRRQLQIEDQRSRSAQIHTGPKSAMHGRRPRGTEARARSVLTSCRYGPPRCG